MYLHGSNFKELLVLLLVHVEAGLHMLDQLHLVHLEFGTLCEKVHLEFGTHSEKFT